MFSVHHDASLQLDMPGGDAGIWWTLWIMRALADDACETGGPAMRLATEIAAEAGQPIANQISGVYDYLRGHIVFKRDPRTFEHVRHPDQLAVEIETNGNTSGDCDDVATLGAALLKCMGLPASLYVISTAASKVFHHVFFGSYIGRQRIYLDPQERMFNRIPPYTRLLEFPFEKLTTPLPVYNRVRAWLASQRRLRGLMLGGSLPRVTDERTRYASF